MTYITIQNITDMVENPHSGWIICKMWKRSEWTIQHSYTKRKRKILWKNLWERIQCTPAQRQWKEKTGHPAKEGLGVSFHWLWPGNIITSVTYKKCLIWPIPPKNIYMALPLGSFYVNNQIIKNTGVLQVRLAPPPPLT